MLSRVFVHFLRKLDDKLALVANAFLPTRALRQAFKVRTDRYKCVAELVNTHNNSARKDRARKKKTVRRKLRAATRAAAAATPAAAAAAAAAAAIPAGELYNG